MPSGKESYLSFRIMLRTVIEPVSKISSAAVDEMRAATSSNFAKKSSVYLSGYTCGFFPRFPRLASHLVNLATKLFLRPVLEPVSKISSAAVDEMRAATSSNFAKKSSVYLSGYTCGFSPRFPRLASHLFNLATKLVLITLLILFGASLALAQSPNTATSDIDTPPPTGSSESQQILALPGSKENQEILAEYAELVKRMREDMGLPEGILPAVAASPGANPTDQDALSKIKIRVITGNEGLPFPSPDKVILEPTPTPQIWPSETPLPTPTPWRPPGRCTLSKSNKVVEVPTETDDTILNDQLFLPEDLMPIDEGEVYGDMVQLYPTGRIRVRPSIWCNICTLYRACRIAGGQPSGGTTSTWVMRLLKSTGAQRSLRANFIRGWYRSFLDL
jgi:hypothetical protein